MNNKRLAVSVAEAARMCGVSRPTLSRWTNIPDFPSIRIGGRVLIPLAGLEKWLDTHAAGAETISLDGDVSR